MAEPLTPELKTRIELKVPSLQYWEYGGSPHNQADMGFICNDHQVAVSFPVTK